MKPSQGSASRGKGAQARAVTTFVAIVALAGITPASAPAGNGGFQGPSPPAITSASCGTDGGYGCFDPSEVQPDGAVTVSGTGFAAGASVAFLGADGAADDVATTPALVSSEQLDVAVPNGAQSGPLQVTNPDGQASNASAPITIRELPRSAGDPNGAPVIQAATSSPSRFYFGAKRQASFTFQILPGSSPTLEARVDLIRAADGAIVRSWGLGAVATGKPQYVVWDGTGADGRIQKQGLYSFKLAVRDANGHLASNAPVRSASRKAGSRAGAAPGSILFSSWRFPIDGPYDLDGFGEGAKFGAGRGGRSHEGFDIESDCGTPLVASRGGVVKWKDYHSLAGNYVVIDPKRTRTDLVYMHLRDPALVVKGDRVYTGQLIGYVGDTGDASACHLHFETWSGGWYTPGGFAKDPYPALKRWSEAS